MYKQKNAFVEAQEALKCPGDGGCEEATAVNQPSQQAKQGLSKARATAVMMSGTIDIISVDGRTTEKLSNDEQHYYAVASRKRSRL